MPTIFKENEERDREIISGDVAGRRGRERKRGGGRNERERWERERVSVLRGREEPKKKKKKKRGLGAAGNRSKRPAKTTSFFLVEKTNSVDTNDRSFGRTKRHVVSYLFERQVVCYIRTTCRSITWTNDRTRNARRHAVCSKTWNDRAFRWRTTRRFESLLND